MLQTLYSQDGFDVQGLSALYSAWVVKRKSPLDCIYLLLSLELADPHNRERFSQKIFRIVPLNFKNFCLHHYRRPAWIASNLAYRLVQVCLDLALWEKILQSEKHLAWLTQEMAVFDLHTINVLSRFDASDFLSFLCVQVILCHSTLHYTPINKLLWYMIWAF